LRDYKEIIKVLAILPKLCKHIVSSNGVSPDKDPSHQNIYTLKAKLQSEVWFSI